MKILKIPRSIWTTPQTIENTKNIQQQERTEPKAHLTGKWISKTKCVKIFFVSQFFIPFAWIFPFTNWRLKHMKSTILKAFSILRFFV